MNKSVLQSKKERDKSHNQLDLIEVQLQGKREYTHDDTGDDHDIHTEVDEWDLRDFRRETTRVQNRPNVTLGSLHDQPKLHTGKDDLLVPDCTRTKQTSWIKDQFTVTTSTGIRSRERRVAEILVRELKGYEVLRQGQSPRR